MENRGILRLELSRQGLEHLVPTRRRPASALPEAGAVQRPVDHRLVDRREVHVPPEMPGELREQRVLVDRLPRTRARARRAWRPA